MKAAVPNECTTWSSSLPTFGLLAIGALACSPAVTETPPPPTEQRPAEAKVEDAQRCDPGPLQTAAESALAAAEAPGTVVVVDLRTGDELVTAATEPEGTAAPPGSTVKPLLALAGLYEGVLVPDETVECKGTWRRGDLSLTCYDTHGSLDLERALTTSCNIFFYDLAVRLGPDKIARRLEDIGFVSLAKQIRHASTDQLRFIATALGHAEANVQPRELAHAYRQLLATSELDIASIRAGMLGVVQADDGTGGKAAVPGLAVAGKTGTAEATVDGVTHTHAWFVGYAPADAPSVLVTVHMDGDGAGGKVAAPVASAVLESWRDACAAP